MSLDTNSEDYKQGWNDALKEIKKILFIYFLFGGNFLGFKKRIENLEKD